MPSAEHAGAATPSPTGWHLPAKTDSHGEIVSNAAAINPARSPPPLAPQQNSLLLLAGLCWGCWHMAAMEGCTHSPVPLARLTGRHRGKVGWGFLGGPEPAGSMSPISPGSQGRQWGADALHQAEGGPCPAMGEGSSLAALPVHTTALKPGWLWPRGPALGGNPGNKVPPCTKRQTNPSHFHNPKPEQQIWCEAPLWDTSCALWKAFIHGDGIGRLVQKQVSSRARAAMTRHVPPWRGQSTAPRGLLPLRQAGGEETSSAVPILELLPRAGCPLRSEGD